MPHPHITADLPGIGGHLRHLPEDFQVEEIPAYEPCGEGEHLYLEVTKRDLTTPALVDHLAGALGLSPDQIGVAGMKDRRAVTTQRLSVPAGTDPERLDTLPGLLGWRSLGLHTNKLRRGHLLANRFRIRVRGATPGWPQRARQVAEALQTRGLPNFYGVQRFGRDGDNARIGEQGVRTGRLFGPRWRRSLMVSAFQSELFNEWLAERIQDGLFQEILAGEVCGRLPQGGVFVAADPEVERGRLQRFEISPMGPLFGHKLMPARGEAEARERALLARRGLALEEFRRVRAEGTRRRCRLPLPDLAIQELEGDPLLTFTLPSGSYATVLLEEILKPDPSGRPEDTPGDGDRGGEGLEDLEAWADQASP